MVDESVIGVGVTDPRVVRVMLETPRHEFVAPEHRVIAAIMPLSRVDDLDSRSRFVAIEIAPEPAVIQ